jgi:hypothetical protein
MSIDPEAGEVPQRPVAQGLAARACESQLWCAIYSAQQAGMDAPFIDQLIRLHAHVGDVRFRLGVMA